MSMTVDEAYDLVMKKVDELRRKGFEVDCNPTPLDPDDEEDNEQFQLDKSKWVHIGIHTQKADELDDLFQLERELFNQGIHFDSGYGFGIRDWELDWSFSVKEN